MARFNQNRALRGTSGYVWINGKELAQIKKIELKITGNFEDMDVLGDYSTFPAYTGWSGEGSLTLWKIDSTLLSLLGDAYKTGAMPEIKIISKLTDPNTGKVERTAVTGVVFTEFNLANYESKGLIEEEVPIKFSDYEILETIA